MMTSPEHLEERRAALEIYLNTVLTQEMYREQGDMVRQYLDFWEVFTAHIVKIINHWHVNDGLNNT